MRPTPISAATSPSADAIADLASTAVTDAKAFTEKEALDGKLIDLIANSPEDLLAKLNGRTITRFNGSTAQLVAHASGDRLRSK